MIYITGDIHGDPGGLLAKPFKNKLEAGDYIIVCGDFSMPCGGKSVDLQSWLDNFETKPYFLLFLDGNHENFDMLNALPVENFAGGRVHKIRRNVFHLMRGELFQLEGHSFFCFGGARSVDRDARIPYVSWWPEEVPSQAEFDHALDNLKKADYQVDYVLTHTAPEQLVRSAAKTVGLGRDYCPVREMLDKLAERISCKAWFCGHMHKDMQNSTKHFYWLFHDMWKVEADGSISKAYIRKK